MFEKKIEKEHESRNRERVKAKKESERLEQTSGGCYEGCTIAEDLGALSCKFVFIPCAALKRHILIACSATQDRTALGALTSRIISDDVAKFLCFFFDIPGTYPDLTNAPACFRQWLETGAEALAAKAKPEDEKQSEDFLRKKFFQDKLLEKLTSPHSKTPQSKTPNSKAPLAYSPQQLEFSAAASSSFLHLPLLRGAGCSDSKIQHNTRGWQLRCPQHAFYGTIFSATGGRQNPLEGRRSPGDENIHTGVQNCG